MSPCRRRTSKVIACTYPTPNSPRNEGERRKSEGEFRFSLDCFEEDEEDPEEQKQQ